MARDNDEIVVDSGKDTLADLFKKEDYWAIWLGFGILAIATLIYFPNPPEGIQDKLAKANVTMQEEGQRAPFKTLAWYNANDAKKKFKASNSSIGKSIKSFTTKPKSWSGNPLNAFVLTEGAANAKKEKATPKYDAAKAKAAEALAKAQASEDAAAGANFQDATLNEQAKAAIFDWRDAKKSASKAKKKAGAKPYNLILQLIGYGVFLGVFFGIGMFFMGKNVKKFFLGFLFIFFLAILAYVLASQSALKSAGLGYALWAIIIGLIISNTIGTPKWAKPAVQVEYYIKTGLVLLGAEILFGKILTIGIPGIFVAWVVTPIVLLTTFWFGQKVIKMPSKELNITISADMSVCGVSAAIATAAACRAKKEELTLAVGLSMVFTSIMMFALPAVIKAMDMHIVLGGAWMGGTIDATGAVAAAGAFLGEKALYVAATIKMIQNVLIGVIAFGVAAYWTTSVEAKATGQKISLWEIWYRFPKFVLGFIVASIVYSVVYSGIGSDMGYVMVEQGVIRGGSRLFRGWFFCLAFVSIGLATDFRELAHHFKGGKPLILYVCGQSLNLVLTLLMAYIMFFLVFPEITAAL